MKKSTNNVLLKEANKIFMQHMYSDHSYQEIYNLFSAASPERRNNAKAVLKKELSLSSSMAVMISMFSIILSIYVKVITPIYLAFLIVFMVLLSLLYIYVFKFLPAIKKATYVLSIIEDI